LRRQLNVDPVRMIASGQKPAHAPMAMMPRLQMSTLGPYSFRVTTSGAIQYGVPTIVVRLACAGSDI
jgi:hypothetical protein